MLLQILELVDFHYWIIVQKSCLELRGRGLIKESYKDKKGIKSALSQELRVMKMVLALLYRNECKTVESKLPNYKILPIEPCYNIPGHNKNIYDQSPYHLVKEEKNILEHVITAFFKEKEH